VISVGGEVTARAEGVFLQVNRLDISALRPKQR
jgi:hypothetical protein